MKINEFDKQVTQADIDQLEVFADKIFSKVGIDVNFTRHFLDRVNDERNGKPISMSELTRLFKQEQKRWGKKIAQLGPDEEAVMKDLQTDINLPFALRWDDKNNELDLIAKTVMRKKNFKTPNPEFPVESKKSVNEDFGSVPPLAELILMAVVAKTSVDMLIGMFKVALKTGKGLKKLNQLRKKVQGIGQSIADYAMPESLEEATRDELLSQLKDRQKQKFYQAALDALHRLVVSKGGKQSVGGYAFDIARAFNGIDGKELEKMYSELHEKVNVIRQSDPLGVLDTLSTRKDNIVHPIKFYDGDVLKVSVEQAKRFMKAYYKMDNDKREIVDKYIKTKNGFQQAIKSLEVRENAFDLLSAALDWKKDK